MPKQTYKCRHSWREMRNVYKILVEKPERKRPFERRRRRWEGNIRMDVKTIGRYGVNWINLACYRDPCWCPSSFIKDGISYRAERPSASQEGLCCMEFVYQSNLFWSHHIFSVICYTLHSFILSRFISLRSLKYQPVLHFLFCLFLLYTFLFQSFGRCVFWILPLHVIIFIIPPFFSYRSAALFLIHKNCSDTSANTLLVNFTIPFQVHTLFTVEIQYDFEWCIVTGLEGSVCDLF